MMTVLILGAGVMQIPAIESAHELGWLVAAADANAEAPGVGLCDRFWHVDLKDRAGLLDAARRQRSETGLDAVFTAGTDFSAMVAWLAEELGLPGHASSAALAASDKLLMRARFDAAGLPSPRFVEVLAEAGTSSSRSMEAALALALPLVVKPADNMGARGCRLARSDDELRLAIDAALPFSRSGRAIVEEYIEGPEYSIDALVYDGAIQLRGLADRHIYFTPFFVELGHTIPSSAPAGLLEELVATFEAGVRALGLSHGAAKGDMKWCPARGSPVIGEIAARLSGGYMSGWTYPYSSGLQLTRDALLLAAGLRPPPTPADRGWVSAERAFISIPGTVGHIAGIRSALAAPHVKDLFLRIKPGDVVSFPSNNVEKCGNIICQAPDREGAILAAEAAVRGILVRLEAPDERTEAFLRGDGSIAGPDGSLWPPPAFVLPPALARSIDQLPDRLPGVAADEGELPVVEAPGWENATARDWSGRTLAESARLAVESAGARLCRSGTGPAIAGLFWRALVRGGVQAGLYVLDREKKGMRSR